jgi:uracil-DNA glycosylase family protein
MSTRRRDDAAPWVPARLSLRALDQGVQECRGCELWNGATQAVMGRGPRQADLMLVGEQPGDQEDRLGRPFVGPAGRLLDDALEDAGIDRGSVWVTNAVKHFRYRLQGKRRIHEPPGRTHVTACRPWLGAELDLVRPTGVILLGATAARSVYGSGIRVTRDRARRLDWPEDFPGHAPGWASVTVHPSSVLRSTTRDEDFSALVADLRAAVAFAPR